MARRVFFSFHYGADSHRVQLVKNMGALEGQKLLNSNDWEKVKASGKAAIERWIDEEMKGTSCLVVLVGSQTASREWVDYEIKKAWSAGKGVMGVHIHRLKDMSGNQTTKGANPFSGYTIGESYNKRQFDQVVNCYDPPYFSSTDVYEYIKLGLASWVDEAIQIRKQY